MGSLLTFDVDGGTLESLTIDGRTVAYRAWRGLPYVEHPVDATYQRLNLYIPLACWQGRAAGPFAPGASPIFLPNTVGGYMPGLPGEPGEDPHRGGPNAIATALARGWVVAAPGARGRTLQDDTGRYTGTAPVCVVDMKAAIRWVRHNRGSIPADTDRIVSNGTSAGGALSSQLGASGNHGDYEADLRALGAAAEHDDLFAASCYCPITNLEHADMAYEWQFHGIGEYRLWATVGTLTPEQHELSAQLKAAFPAYVNGLGLTAPDGSPLRLDADGTGGLADHIIALLVASAQHALEGGADLGHLPWLTMAGSQVTAIDFQGYLRHIGRMKPTPAFDGLDLSTPENELFGSPGVRARHFTALGQMHSADDTRAEDSQVRRMNPMGYLNDPAATVAPHWRIRHGAADRDTSFAIPVLLAAGLRAAGRHVDFALPWGVPHAGDYDLPALFDWMEGVVLDG